MDVIKNYGGIMKGLFLLVFDCSEHLVQGYKNVVEFLMETAVAPVEKYFINNI